MFVSVAVYNYDKETVERRKSKEHLARLSDKTLCMIAVQGPRSQYTHYDVHSLYGASQIRPTLRSRMNTRFEKHVLKVFLILE